MKLKNLLMYIGAYLFPCTPPAGGFFSFCQNGISGYFGAFIMFALQFGIFFNFDDPSYYLSTKASPNMVQALIIWAVVLSPFIINKVGKVISEKSK
jgi:hypothetical protein